MVNPYESPPPVDEEGNDAQDAAGRNVAVRRDGGLGPGVFIAIGGLMGGFVAMAGTYHRSLVDFLWVPAGCVTSGLLFRLRSRHWPVDPTAWRRQLLASAAAVVCIPGGMAAVVGLRAQGFGMTLIGLIVGVSLACGILASGTRRSGRVEENQPARSAARESDSVSTGNS